MPELPEVETVVRDLRPHLTGCRIRSVAQVSGRALRKPWCRRWEESLTGRRIEAVTRRGKWVVLVLEGGSSLVIHLGMTGQLTQAEGKEPLPGHTHLVFGLDGDRQLRFRDVRRFGSATLFDTVAEREAFFAGAGLGPEPFDLRPAAWRRSLAATSRCLKAVLLDQRVVAGVGNIYADESLFQARLHPGLSARVLAEEAPPAAERLRRAIATVLRRAIERRGSSIRDYVGGSGQKGGYQDEFRVYGRTGAPCPRCRTAIARVRLAGRSTHFCPNCQQD